MSLKTYAAKELELILRRQLIKERIRLNEWQLAEMKCLTEEKGKATSLFGGGKQGPTGCNRVLERASEH
ncbi:MAG: hypothetical protein DRO05_02720 [Thermoproteota archaeon]|nr:MAG: hypothetical protein DRO05_02720 [Candidatus Korarchaeota archaeon]